MSSICRNWQSTYPAPVPKDWQPVSQESLKECILLATTFSTPHPISWLNNLFKVSRKRITSYKGLNKPYERETKQFPLIFYPPAGNICF